MLDAARRPARVSPAAGTTGPRPDPARRTGLRRTRMPRTGNDLAPGPARPSSSPIPARRAACPACAWRRPVPQRAAPAAAACGRAGHLRTAASTSSGCCATPCAPLPRSGRASPSSAPAVPRSPHHVRHSQHNPGQGRADRAQVMIMQSRPTVSNTTRRADRQRTTRPPQSRTVSENHPTHRQVIVYVARWPFHTPSPRTWPARTTDLPGIARRLRRFMQEYEMSRHNYGRSCSLTPYQLIRLCECRGGAAPVLPRAGRWQATSRTTAPATPVTKSRPARSAAHHLAAP